ncbi:glutathione S-transferase alpha-4-like [Eudromia elegans]
MSGKPKLIYFNGRGRMELIGWLLAAAGVEFEETFLDSREQYLKLIKDGCLLFQQVPLVEMDGMKMVQTRAILSYIAGKYNLYGKDLKERALIDMYVEGITDLTNMIITFPFSPPEAKEKNLALIMERATHRYFPVFEKLSTSEDVPIRCSEFPHKKNMLVVQALKQHGQDFLVGNKVSWADIQLIEAILAVEERFPAVLSGFPQLQVTLTLDTRELLNTKNSRIAFLPYSLQYLQGRGNYIRKICHPHLTVTAFKKRMSNMPAIKKFLQPGSPRKPPPDDHYVATVLNVLTEDGNLR